MMTIEQEHKEELIREEAREVREEPMYIWIEEQKDNLMKEFVEMYEDEFREYCIKEFHKQDN